MISKSLILDLTELLAVGSVTTAGYLIGGTVGASVMAGLGINLASTIIGNGSSKLKARWIESKDGILNHDMQRALLRAYLKSLSHIKDCYFSENDDLPKQDKKQINQLIENLTKTASTTFIPDIEKSIQQTEITQYLYGNQNEGEELLHNRIKSVSYLDEYGESFKSYFLSKILSEIKFWFGEELKTDSIDCNKAWRAFQRLLLEGIKVELTDVKASQEEIKADLSRLIRIEEDINKLTNVIDSRASNEPFLLNITDIQNNLSNISEITTRTENKIDLIHKSIQSIIGNGEKTNKNLTDINQQDNNSIQNNSDSIIPDEIKDKIELARKATRKGNFTQSTRIWKTIRDFSLNTDDKKLTIRANLEIALSMVRDDRHDLENPLKIANDCLNESKKVNLGNQKGRVLQILGEIHRLKGNIDQARGFQNASIEYSKEKGEKDIEAWTYLSMSLLSKSIKEPIDIQLGYVKQAYDAFTNLQITSKDNNNENTISGYAACHTLRADIFGYNQFDKAISEYSLALSLYKQLGKSWEYDLGKIYLERGEMQIMRDDFEQGVQDLINAEKIFTKLRNHYMAAKCIMACAELLDKRGARTESEKYFKSAFLKVSLVKDEHKQSWFYFRYAMKLLELGEHDSAKQILLVLLSRKSTTDSQKLDVLKTLSDLAKILKDDDELLQYEEYSLSIIEKLIYEAIKPNEKLRLIIKKAQAYEGLKKYELALETFDRAIKLSESLQAKDAIADCWASKAQVYGFMDNKVEERKAYEYVITLIGEDNESPQLITTLTMLAQIEVKESNFNKAREFLDKAEILCKNIMPFMLFVINDIRSRLAEAEGNQIKKE